MTDNPAAPRDAQIAVTLSTIAYDKSDGTQEEQREAMRRDLANPALPTDNAWRLVWGPVTVHENLAYITEGPVIGPGPARQYAYAIRGTVMEPWNLIEDGLDALGLRDLPWDASSNAHISRGIKHGWENLTAAQDGGQTALEFLRNVPSGSQLIVTGHSLGAMLASAMALYFDYELGSGIDVAAYTFAAPTAGDQGFADAYASRFDPAGRYYNCLDVVPRAYNYDDFNNIKELFPCGGVPHCGNHLACRHLINLGLDIAEHRYFHPAGGTRLQAKVYATKSGSFVNFLKEALDQHHATHYMWMLGISLDAIHVLDASWEPPEKPCPCPED